MKELELRMYFFVPYNISPIQQAIQAGHAALEYARIFSNEDMYKDFVDNWKTWIILNGGTTNNGTEYANGAFTQRGTMQDIFDTLVSKRIKFSIFKEPDLNNAMTAICFICDERTFNTEKYPYWEEYSQDYYKDCDSVTDMDIDDLRKEWINLIGGEKNILIKELLRDKKLA